MIARLGDFRARERTLFGARGSALSRAVARDLVGPRPLDLTSPTQRAIAALVARGFGDREVERELRLGVATVRTHLARAFEKTGTSSRAELAALALRAS